MIGQFMLEHWEVLSFILALVFNAGVVWKSVKERPTEARVNEMIEKKFNNHCPFTDRITELELNKKEMLNYREVLAKNLFVENERNHLSLQRMELNLKRVCDKLEIGYLE